MRVPCSECLPVRPHWLSTVLFSFVAILGLALSAWGQGTYMAQLRGLVRDKSGAMVAGAKLVLTEDATNVSHPVTSDAAGQYIFVSLRPSTYTLRVEAPGFEPVVNRNIVLAVSQQSELDFILKPAVATTTVEVVDTVPLLDAGSASLGTEVTNEFISGMPLNGRNITNLVYLSAGVTTLDNTPGVGYPTGTNFASNGQRYSTAEIRLDGALATGPEQGEGATSNLSYMPSAEVVQEFKLQNNSFAAEYGSNGGTVMNVVMKSGANKFHGSGWWFGQRTDLNANYFYNNLYGVPRSNNSRDQYGFSLTGPIIKGKTFFLFDLERVRQNSVSLESGRVPTAAELTGDFSQTLVPDNYGNAVNVQIFNPFAPLDINGNRPQFVYNGVNNVIPPALITAHGPIGPNLAAAYPAPTGPLNTSTWTNFQKDVVITSPSTQFDIKIDHELSAQMHLMGRYSQNNSPYHMPSHFYSGENANTVTRNVVLEYTWTVSPRLLWTNRIGLDRYHEHSQSNQVDPTQFGLPSLFKNANGLARMPWITGGSELDNFTPGDYTTLGNECCDDTINGHTQYNYSSSISWVHGKHSVKFGGEQRAFFNNFWQPDYPTGEFSFTRGITAQVPVSDTNITNGSGLASMLLGFPNDGLLNVKQAMADKSLQTDFYIQDDWKISSRLTVNVGLRYEWSVPYTERHNLVQFSDFTADSGQSINLAYVPNDAPPLTVSAQALLQSNGVSIPTTQELYGTTVFPTSSHRHVPIDRNNWGPRLGFAYQIEKNTMVRGGAGVFYGMTNYTNWQYPGTAFQTHGVIHFLAVDNITQYATLGNPFPTLPANTVPQPQATKYGALAEWGFDNSGNMEGMAADHNPEIYQWNLGVQHLFPMGVVLSADYSANRSTHLPWGGVQAYPDALPDKLRQQLVNNLDTSDTTLSPVTDLLATPVGNPFEPMFQGPGAIFNEPDSRYNQPTIPLSNLLNRYPQFDGGFTGQEPLKASSWYNGLLVRFQKRPTHGLSFEGSYTWSKATDNSSYGANNWIYFGGSGQGTPQDVYNLKAEHSISANDTPQRFVLATVYELPFGRKRWLGGGMNRVLDGIVGGWSVNSLLTFASGQPIAIADGLGRLSEGQQRPNITCSHPLSGLTLHQVAIDSLTNPNANYFNLNCFSEPGDQVPGNAPRFSANARGEGDKNLDMGVFKGFEIKEGMKIELRAEFFNFTNSTRFVAPPAFYGAGGFGIPNSNVNNGQINAPRVTQVAVRFEF